MINYDTQREELVTQLKEKCLKEIDEFKNDKRVREYIRILLKKSYKV